MGEVLCLVGGGRLVRWGWDCIDCEGDFGSNDRCDTCRGTNRIPLYALQADADRFNVGESRG